MGPYVTLVAVVSSIAATKVFEEVFLMTQGGPADTRTIVYYVYDQAFAELEISYACTPAALSCWFCCSRRFVWPLPAIVPDLTLSSALQSGKLRGTARTR